MNKWLLLGLCVTLLAVSCSGQGLFGGLRKAAGRLLAPIINRNNGKDGYEFSYATEDQVREEKGEFVNGVWTVKGSVQWLDPDMKMKHTEKYTADDQGYRAEVEDEPFEGRALSPGALASLAG